MQAFGRASRSKKRYRAAIVSLVAVIVILVILVSVVTVAYYRQMRLNRFTRNIMLSENVFLRGYSYETGEDDAESRHISCGYNESFRILTEIMQESNVLDDAFAEKELPAVLDAMQESNVLDDASAEKELLAVLDAYFDEDHEAKADEFALMAIYYRTVSAVSGRPMPYVLFPDDVMKRISEYSAQSQDETWEPEALFNFLADMLTLKHELYSDAWMWEDPGDGYNRLYSYHEYVSRIAELTAYEGAPVTDTEEIVAAYYRAIGHWCEFRDCGATYSEVMKVIDACRRDTVRILDVAHLCQNPEYPNGCEAVSAVMLARHAGIDIDKTAFILNYLPCGEIKISFGVRFGPDPEKMYAGDPASDKGGWGCFAPVIAEALNACLSDRVSSLTALDLTGITLTELCRDYIDRGIPAAIWVTTDFEEVDEVYQWLSYDRENVYLYPKNQHCAVLIGYDSENYYLCDPLSERSVTAVARDRVAAAYASMGRQAVILFDRAS